MLTVENCFLVIIDVQGKLANQMYEKEALFESLQKLVKGIKAFGIPIFWIEQNPEGLGPTIPEIAELLSDKLKPIPKFSFSCCGNESFMQKLEKIERKQAIIAGIETHVCVYQTTMDMLNLRYEVHIVADAVSSREAKNKKIALERMQSEGAKLTSTEMALFELLKKAEGEKFKTILNIVK